MIEYYKTVNKRIRQVEELSEDVWVNIVNPSIAELEYIYSETTIDINTLSTSLDREERSRLETEDNYTMVLIDVPVDESEVDSEMYSTMPLAIFILDKNIITISYSDVAILSKFKNEAIRDFSTSKRSRFLFQILQQNAFLYLKYLRHIDRTTTKIEKNIYNSVKNKELIQILNLEKSLIYFSTSLKSNDLVLTRIMRTKSIPKYEDDEDLLEDVIMDNKQALEMATIYGDILSRIMDAFSSIISNNQNRVMSILTTLTIIMSVFTIISGFFGMNVPGIPLNDNSNAFVIILIVSVVISAVLGILILVVNKKMLNRK